MHHCIYKKKKRKNLNYFSLISPTEQISRPNSYKPIHRVSLHPTYRIIADELFKIARAKNAHSPGADEITKITLHASVFEAAAAASVIHRDSKVNSITTGALNTRQGIVHLTRENNCNPARVIEKAKGKKKKEAERKHQREARFAPAAFSPRYSIPRRSRQSQQQNQKLPAPVGQLNPH